MERKPFTLRLSTELYDALTMLSEVVDRSMNDLVSEAVVKFVAAESKVAARDLEKTLASLRAYTGEDPDFERAIESFAKAEAKHDDPLERQAHIRGGPIRRRVQALLTDG